MDIKKLSKEDVKKQINTIHENLVNQKLNCAERTFLTVKSFLETNIPSEAVGLLTGFGGGIGGTHGSVCGAVTGGVCALGLLYGRRKPAEESSEKAYDVARDFICQFKSKFGTEVCGELIGDLLRVNKFDSDERRKRCFNYTLNAIKLCTDIIIKNS